MNNPPTAGDSTAPEGGLWAAAGLGCSAQAPAQRCCRVTAVLLQAHRHIQLDQGKDISDRYLICASTFYFLSSICLKILMQARYPDQ